MRSRPRPPRRHRAALATTALLAALARGAVARGDPPPRPRRAVPDYDGRGRAPPTVGESLAWVPRVLLYPVYAVTEYGIRAPLGWLFTQAEHARLFTAVTRGSTDRPNQFVLLPTVGIDLGLASSVGLYAAWNRAIWKQQSVHLHVSTGGAAFWFVGLSDRWEIAPRTRVGVESDFFYRNDWRFYGIGPNTNNDVFERFGWGRYDARLFFDSRFPRHLGGRAVAGFRGDFFGGPTLVPLPQQPVPPGYQNLWVFHTGATVFADSRDRDRPNTTGARLEVRGQYAVDLAQAEARQWVSWEAEGSLYWEVLRPGRVLSVRAYAGFVEPTSRAPVPFVDLIALGGTELMRGWYFGRFLGASAATFTLNYRYPIWYLVDGDVFVEAGNAFGDYLAGFAPQRLFGSAGVGIRTTGDRDQSLDLLLAVGTSRFDQPFAIQSFRIAVGWNRGF